MNQITDKSKLRKYGAYIKDGMGFITEAGALSKIVFIILLIINAGFMLYAVRLIEELGGIIADTEEILIQSLENVFAGETFSNYTLFYYLSIFLTIFILGIYATIYVARLRHKNPDKGIILRIYATGLIRALFPTLFFGFLSCMSSYFLFIPMFIVMFTYTFYFCFIAESASANANAMIVSVRLSQGMRMRLIGYGLFIKLGGYAAAILAYFLIALLLPAYTSIILITALSLSVTIQNICIIRMYASIYNDITHFTEKSDKFGEQDKSND